MCSDLLLFFVVFFFAKKCAQTIFNSLYLLNLKAECPKNDPFHACLLSAEHLLNNLLFSELKPVVASVIRIVSFSRHR